MAKYFILIFLQVFCYFSAHANEKEYVVLNCRSSAGMFSIFCDVLSLVKHYEKGLYNGIEVDFEAQGLYYSYAHGLNWWEYYCEPIKYGEKVNAIHVMGDCPGSPAFDIERHTSRQEAFSLIQTYIHFKPAIMQEIDRFEQENFCGNFVIGVHYRGTDKIEEAPRVDYFTVLDKVVEEIGKLPGDRYKIFVATDEEAFLQYMISHFGNAVCYNKKALRSTNGFPLHFSECDRYAQGLDSIIDCVLLSRSQYLIRTNSNLSLWSTFFNPDVPVFEINQRHP